MYDEHLLAAARRVLDGDESASAVSALEGVLLEEYPGDERFEELSEALASDAPGMGSPYLGRTEIRDVIREAVKVIDAKKRPLMPRTVRLSRLRIGHRHAPRTHRHEECASAGLVASAA